MDQGSQKLMKALIDEFDWKHVMLIVICREEDFSTVSYMFEGKGNDDSLLSILVKNLNVDEVHDMVTNILNLDKSSTQNRSLSELIYQRTLGSPFYVMEFLDLLFYEEMIIPNSLSTPQWSFDIEMIRRETMIANNLVPFFLSKVQRIHDSVREALSVASLIGFRFDSKIVIDALAALHQTNSMDQLSSSSLLEAQLFGFIEPLHNHYFQFRHDQVQDAFQSMLTEDKARKVHNHVAMAYLTRGGDESFYHAVRHMIKSYEDPANDETKVSLAHICLKAAIYCQERSDFFGAASILRFAWNIIPEDQKWLANYNLTLSLAIALAKVELILGNFEACRQFNQEVLTYARSVGDQLEILETYVEEAIADARTKDCEVALYEALAVVHVWIPRKVSTLSIMQKLFKVKGMLRGKSKEFILGMSMMTDMTKVVAVKLLMFGAMFGLRNNNEKHSIYCSLVAIELSLKFGLSKYTPDAFAVYSMALLVLGKLSNAYEFANISRTLNEQLKCRNAGSISILLVNNMVTHWKEPIRDLIRPTLSAVQSCMESGDLSFGIFGAAILMGIRTCAGHHLKVLRKEFDDLYSNYKCYRLDRSWRILEPNVQFIMNLSSSGSLENRRALTDLSGEIMIEADYIENAITSKTEVLLPLLYVLKIQLAFYFDQFLLGEQVLQQMKPFQKILSYGFNFCRWQLFGSLINYARYHESCNWKYIRKARKYKRAFHTKAMMDCPNARPLLMILNAEDASVSCSESEALEEYKKAIQVMSHEGFVNLEALACERVGKLLLQKGTRDNEGIRFLKRSIELYEYGWGATAKADDLREFMDTYRSSSSVYRLHVPHGLIEFFVDESHPKAEHNLSQRSIENESTGP
jgi:histidine kinase